MSSTTWAGTPTGIGPALPPSYYTDATAEVAEFEAERERSLCDVDTLVDWLASECMGARAYEHRSHYRDETLLARDYANAAALNTPELLALAMGLAVKPAARIAAMDELAKRAGVPE